VPRKPLAVIGLAGIALATTLAALAPTFEVLLAARVLGGVSHGLFWAVAAAYAADLVPASRLGRATAITAAGGSLAGVLGVPLGNAIGQALGWRAAFGVVAACAVLVVVLVALLLPPVTTRARIDERTHARVRSNSSSALPGVLLVCAIILLVVIGQTTFGTYSVVWLTDVASIPPATIPVYLLGTGAAAFIAVSAIGRLADRFPRPALLLAVASVAGLIATFPIVLAWGIPSLIVVALAQSMAFAVAPMLLQAQMMRVAAPHQRSTAAALQTTAFNLAIGGGAVIGALAVGAWGLEVLPWLSALLTTAGLGVLLVSNRPAVRRSSSPVSSASTPTEVPNVP
jgi:predicted MFS family arabinose efflux permease